MGGCVDAGVGDLSSLSSVASHFVAGAARSARGMLWSRKSSSSELHGPGSKLWRR
jgi:hypothetical protein